LGSVCAGDSVNYRVGTVSEGSYAFCDALPAGLNIQLIGDGVYVTGAPLTAGSCRFVIYTGDAVTGNIVCDITVSDSTPEVSTSSDVDCFSGDSVRLTCAAISPDGSPLSYQWFAGCASDGSGGYPIAGAYGSEYFPETSSAGTFYYCCCVTGGSARPVTVSSRPIRVTVSEMQVSGIAVNTLPYELKYENGELYNVQGLSIEVFYTNGRSEVITDGFSLSADRYDRAAGTLTLIAEYRGQTCSFTVSVPDAEPPIAALGMVVLPSKQNYTVGESVDAAGIVFRIFYRDGTYTDTSEDFTLEPSVLSYAGTQTVTLFHKGYSCSFEVNVSSPSVSPDVLEIASTPSKLSYTVGESLDTAGLVLRDTVNGVSRPVSSGYSVEPSSFTSSGRQTVTVRYNGKTASFTVDVKESAAVTTDTGKGSDTTPRLKLPDTSKLSSIAIGKANKGAIIIVLVIALLALGALGIYMVVLENGGLEEIKYKLECKAYDIHSLFEKRKK
ncbi:MAG: bacterial Ig-like domain-containing protein, partial [Eubacteriales bacterium]|nr:bacterial Ig-like domain-containing protein [Eubacteriales bacterium]